MKARVKRQRCVGRPSASILKQLKAKLAIGNVGWEVRAGAGAFVESVPHCRREEDKAEWIGQDSNL